MDRWSFYQVVAYDRQGQQVYFDRPRSLFEFALLSLHGLTRWSRRGRRTFFKLGPLVWSIRCRPLPWRPW